MDSDWLQGNEPVAERLNVRRELRHFRHDPLLPLLRKIRRGPHAPLLVDDVARYEEAYHYFFLSLQRFLPEMSVGLRWRNGPYYARKEHRRFTAAAGRLTQRYHAIESFLFFDFWNCLLHSRILCDRSIALTRHFLRGPNLPSFTSFAEHKKFFQKGRTLGAAFRDYEHKIVNDTAWFEIPLKHVRDKYIVHVATSHMRFFGYAQSGDLQLILSVPSDHSSERPMASAVHIMVSVRRLARDIHAFLEWLAHYGGTRIAAA